jgi:plasmid stabilization system protein ParE
MIVINITPQAEKDYDEIRLFLLGLWNEKIANNFYDLVAEQLNILYKSPTSFGFINKKSNVRKVIIHKHVTMFYIYYAEQLTIDVLSFFDNRQDPAKLKLS